MHWHPIFMSFIRTFLHHGLGPAKEDTSSWGNPHEDAWSRSRALVMSYTILAMLLSALIVNIAQNVSGVLLPLAAIFVIQSLGLVWIYKGGCGHYVMLANSLLLMMLGIYILIYSPVEQGGSLCWFLLFPPMLTLCTGLRTGSIIFCFFYLSLLLMLLTPLDSYLYTDYPMAVRWRFLLAILGSYLFSFLAEYQRMRTHRSLVQALIRLNSEAKNDTLTGLGNRRDFRDFYKWVTSQCRRKQRPYAVGLVDLDFFKQVNDTYGHLTGDKVLVHVANTLRTSVRDSDRVFRWGGEEFMIVLHECPRNEALKLAERLRIKVEQSPCLVEGKPVPLTISIGMYCAEGHSPPENCVAIADANLYLAKQQGRNRVLG